MTTAEWKAARSQISQENKQLVAAAAETAANDSHRGVYLDAPTHALPSSQAATLAPPPLVSAAPALAQDQIEVMPSLPQLIRKQSQPQLVKEASSASAGMIDFLIQKEASLGEQQLVKESSDTAQMWQAMLASS